MFDLTIAIPVIVGIVSAAKTAGLRSKYAPLLSIGIGVGALYLFGDGTTVSRLFEGLIAGLSASGLYSSAKAVTK